MSILATILGKVAGVASGGMSVVYKYLAIAGVVLAIAIGSYFYGHHVGTLAESNAILKQATKQQIKTITIEHTQTVIDTTAVTKLQKQVDQLSADKKDLQAKLKATPTKELTNIITGANGVTSCVLSKSWVDLFNQSVNGVQDNTP